jgi:hypothetical protein
LARFGSRPRDKKQNVAPDDVPNLARRCLALRGGFYALNKRAHQGL